MKPDAKFFSKADVVSTYRFLAHQDRGVTELRVIAPGRGIIGIGYFDNEDAFVKACDKANGTGNVYVGIQPRPKRLLEQASNRVVHLRKGSKDEDIEWLTSIVIDIDPERPKHTAATEDELKKAIARGEQISDWLVEKGYAAPVRNMSGNGCQLWFAVPPFEITETNREEITGKLRAFETKVRDKFGGNGVAIDSIYNLSRIIKVIGTRSIKGQNTAERPHRLSASLGGFERHEDAKLFDAILSLSVSAQPREATRSESSGPPVVGEALSEHVLGILSSSTKLTALFEGRGKTAMGSDGKRLDNSSSGYDFSLALAVAAKGVTDPSELATVLWHRPDGGAKEKGQAYVERTVQQALARYQTMVDKPTKGASERRSDDGSSLPTIIANDRELRHITDDALEALMRANDPPVVFQRGALPIRIQLTDNGLRRLVPYLQSGMRGRLGRVANWSKEVLTRDGDIRVVSVSPPLDVVQDVLSLPSWPFPSIEGVVECPVFSPDGHLMTHAGYHPHARLWIHLDENLTIPPVSTKPADSEIQRARELLLNELLAEFPFVDEASRANALAVLLLPFVRGMIDGPTPLHLIDAPAPGTGKSLLADAISIPSTGQPAFVMTEGRDDDEWRKRLTAAISQASVFLLLDNLRHRLDSSQLSAAITARTWTDRILGHTATAVLPVRVIWMATANNVALSNEIARRCVWIRLDAKVDQPWMRSGFRHADLRAWARKRRGDLVWACLTLGQAWIAADRPPGRQHLGNFEAWVMTLGGILDVAGVRGFLGNAQELYARTDEETCEWRDFVQQWWERHHDKPVQVHELFCLANETELLGAILGDKSERSQKIRLGKALAKMRERVVGDHRIETAGQDKSSRNVYRLRPHDKASPERGVTLSMFDDTKQVGKTSANFCPDNDGKIQPGKTSAHFCNGGNNDDEKPGRKTSADFCQDDDGDEPCRKTSANFCPDNSQEQDRKTSAHFCQDQNDEAKHDVEPAEVENDARQKWQKSGQKSDPNFCQSNTLESQGFCTDGRSGRSVPALPTYIEREKNDTKTSGAHALRSPKTYATSAESEKTHKEQEVKPAEVVAEVGQKWQKSSSVDSCAQNPSTNEDDWEVFDV